MTFAASDYSQSPEEPHPDSNFKDLENFSRRDGLEVWLGTHLNKLGVIFLVTGMALLMVNQFQYFAPIFKVLMGLASGAALIATGLWFEKKRELSLYGYVLSAGGWALTYFTAYAAHHIESVRIIHNPVLALVLLMGISLGAVLHFLRLRSELITTISLSLAFLTTCFSSVSLFTLISCAVLVASLVFIVAKMRWYWLYLSGVISTYAIYIFFLLPNVFHDPWIQSFGLTASQTQFWLTIGFSSLFWAAFGGVLMILDETTKTRKAILLSAGITNCMAYALTVLGAMDVVYPEKRIAFVLSLALAYAMSASGGMRQSLPGISTLHRVFALFFASLAVPLQFSKYWVSAIWLLEVPLLAYVGLKNKMPVYNRFAIALGSITFLPFLGFDIWNNSPVKSLPFPISEGKLLAAIGTITYLTAFACHRFFEGKNGVCSRLYFFYAATIAAMATLGYSHENFRALSFIVGGGIAAYLGFRLKDTFVRRIGEIGILIGIVAVNFGPGIYWLDMIAAGLLLVIDWLYRPFQTQKLSVVRTFLTLAAVSLLGGLTEKIFGFEGCALVWAILSITLLIAGFAVKDKVYRVSALIVLLCSALNFNQYAYLNHSANQFAFAWTNLQATLLSAGAALSAWLHYHPSNRDFIGKRWNVVFTVSVLMGYIVLQKLISIDLPIDIRPIAYSAASLIPITVGSLAGNATLRLSGCILGTSSSLYVLGSPPASWNVTATVLLAAMNFGHYLSYKNIACRREYEKEFHHGFAMLGTLLLTGVIGAHAGTWTSLLWALQGLLTLVLGFLAKDKFFRIGGLALLGMVCGKLILIDSATLNMTYRIMSLIAIGLVLLLVSFMYVRNSARTENRGVIN